MNQISFNCANFVARQVGYTIPDEDLIPGNWMRCDAATQEWFRPLETFQSRFSELLDEVARSGLTVVDIWPAQIHQNWATDEHVRLARESLESHGFTAASAGGRFGDTREEFERSCKVYAALGARYLCGPISAVITTEPEWARETLEANGLRFGIENHPETTPDEVVAKIPEAAVGAVGACVDTGWFGTRGYDAARAIEELGDNVVYVHLKDVLAEGTHLTCTFGEGIVPIEGCVQALRKIGYTDSISIEHEPGDRDPLAEVLESRARLERWLAE